MLVKGLLAIVPIILIISILNSINTLIKRKRNGEEMPIAREIFNILFNIFILYLVIMNYYLLK